MAGKFYRRVIRIQAWDSPNVRLAQRQVEAGLEPTDEIVVPGVIWWSELQRRLATRDEAWLAVSVHAQFWKGKDLMLFPADWLTLAVQRDVQLRQAGQVRKARGIGIDPAEGGDKTAMAASDEHGLIELVSRKTPNTVDVVNEALAFMRRHGMDGREECPRVIFDAGGGGKEHADRLRDWGYPVRTVAFGEGATPLPRRGGGRMYASLEQRIDQKEENYVYFNRRAEMYGELSQLLDPGLAALQGTNGKGGGPSAISNGNVSTPLNGNGTQPSNGTSSSTGSHGRQVQVRQVRVGAFAIPAHTMGEQYKELLHQLSKFPRKYDPEGRLKLPPKNPRAADSKEVSLTALIGHSPDESDAFALSVWAMIAKVPVVRAGAAT